MFGNRHQELSRKVEQELESVLQPGLSMSLGWTAHNLLHAVLFLRHQFPVLNIL